MDPVIAASIASGAVSILVPFLKSLGEEFAKSIAQELGSKAGETAWKRAKKLYEFIKSKVTSKPEFEKVITSLEESPDDADTQAMVRYHLKELMTVDESFARELSELVKQVTEGKSDVVFTTTILGNVQKLVQIGTVIGDVNI